ncbi:MAG: AMP-binding protein [Cyanobacteriota bacterium]
MSQLVKIKNNEFSFFFALTLLILSLSSFSYFLLIFFESGSMLLKAITLSTFAASTGIFFINKNLLHQLLRPVATFLLTTFWQIEVEGAENIPEKGSVLLAGNHTGLVDALIVSVACKRPVNFIMTNEVFSWPFAGKLVGLFNVIPVVGGRGMDALGKGIDKLNEDKVLCIFPEGRCTEDGKLNRFHRGVARIQTRSNAPLVPFAILGGMDAWKIGSMPKPAKIKIQIGLPMNCSDLKEKEITDQLKDRVQFMLESLERVKRHAENKVYQNKVLSVMEEKTDTNATNKALSIKENDQWKDLSYSELSQNARNFADYLIESGIRKGERIAILSESRPEWGIAFFAAIRSGATIVPLDVKLTGTELNSILSDSKPSIICVSNKYLSEAKILKNNISSIKKIYIIEDKSQDEEIASINNLKGHKVAVNKNRSLDETALIVYTSGTTGNPKGVMITFDNIITQLRELETMFPLTAADRYLSVLPLNHLLELTCGFLGVLFTGGNVIYSNKLSPKAVTKTMQEKQVTYMVAVPLFLKMLKNSVEKQINKQNKIHQHIYKISYQLAKYIPSKLFKKAVFSDIHKEFGGKLKGFISGGAPLDHETAEFFDRIGLPVYQGYGLTETSPIISSNSPINNRMGSVGKVISTLELQFSTEGEILVKGPSIMKGYFNREDLTEEVIDSEGWFHTGDIGELDNDGYLYITGRIKNLIVLGGGKKIFPEEVETVLSKSSNIKELCVVGSKINSGNKEGTEQVCAIVVPSEELIFQYRDKQEEIEKHINAEINTLSQNLAQYKRPTRIIVNLNELPKTATRKIKRKQVQQWLECQINPTEVA